MDNVLIIGSGGREHALAWKLSQSEHVDKVYCAPGNGGTELDGFENIPTGDFVEIGNLVRAREIGLTVVGPEVPLVDGIVDFYRDTGLIKEGYLIFGPTKAAAQLEGSKAFAKEIMGKGEVPTAKFEVFDDADKAKAYVKENGERVVKADGLAAGKGVIVPNTIEETIAAIEMLMIEEGFPKIVLEEKLEGEEASVLALTDGKTIKTLISSQDHKPAFGIIEDGDRWLAAGGDKKYKYNITGPNTGGMGAYAPAPMVTPEVMKQVYNEILRPTVRVMAEEGIPFQGCLYAGLMIKDGQAKVVEYNVRFGDPETQPVLSLLKNDLYLLLNACAEGKLDEHEIENKEGGACCVVMASGGYPGSYEKGKEISGLAEASRLPGIKIYHAGTKVEGDKVFTDGGRGLGPAGAGKDIEQAVGLAYKGVHLISWENKFYRTDIGARALRR